MQISSSGEPLGPDLKLGCGRRTGQTLGLAPLLSELTLTDIGAGLAESVLIELRLGALGCGTHSSHLLLLTLDAVLTALLLDPLLYPGGRMSLLGLTLQTLETLAGVPPAAGAWTGSVRLKRLERINKIHDFRASDYKSISERNIILLN